MNYGHTDAEEQNRNLSELHPDGIIIRCKGSHDSDDTDHHQEQLDL